MGEKLKKTGLWDRLKKAVKAFQGKPAQSLELGVVVKRCSDCDRSDCEQCVYKNEFNRLLSLPNCNDCIHNSHSSCGFRPLPGEDVRINCALWEPKKE